MNLSGRHIRFHKQITIFALLLVALLCNGISAQESGDYEEIVLRFEVPKLITQDIMVQYDGEHVFLPVSQIFSLLRIELNADYENGEFKGKFISQNEKYYINYQKYEAKCFGNTISLTNRDLMFKDNEIYLRRDLYSSIFDLNINFNFAELQLYLPLDKDFPIYQELKREAAHKRLREMKSSQSDVYELHQKRSLFKCGVADWIITANPLEKNGQYFGLNLGALVLGGDVSLSGTGNSVNGFDPKQLRYNWHYVFDNNKYISQIEAGNIGTYGSLARSLKGALVTNRPEVQRKFFKTINITGEIGPGWEVELFVNNKLVDYMATDQNGEYNFLIDINYGTSNVDLRMYGPNGEIVSKQEDIKIPYNLIPKNSLEYMVAGGTMEAMDETRNYVQGGVQYGLLNNVTLSFETDIPVANDSNEAPLYATSLTFQPLGNFIVNGVLSPNNELSLSFNYTKQSLISLSGEYTDYYENEFQNRLNQLDNFNFSVSSPLKIKGKYLGLRYRYSRSRFIGYAVTNMYYGMKLPLYKFLFNYIGNYKISEFSNRTESQIASQLFLSTSFLKFIRPQLKINYEHDINRVSGYGLYLQKRIFSRGQLGFSVERNSISKTNQFMVTFNLFTGIADFTSRAHFTGNNTIITQTQKGSIRFDQDNGSFTFDRRNGTGLASTVIWPFHDANFNGVLDEGEEILPELRAKVGGAQGKRKGKNNLYYYDGLRPYDDYIIQIDPYSLDDPTLQPAHENYKVSVLPNVVTSVNVPIVTAGGISGSVTRDIDGSTRGVGGTRIIVTNEITNKEVIISSFSDGEFFYLGIVPGMYRIRLDQEQLKQFNYKSEPEYIDFQINTVKNGDSIEDLNFKIIPLE